MALNMKKVNTKNKADEMIEQMMSESSSSSASYVKALTNISGQSAETNNAHTEKSTKELPVEDEKTHGVDIDLDIAKPDIEETDKKPISASADKVTKTVPQKIEHTGEKKRGRRPKAETGEICRVQFSTTLMPDLLDRVKSEAKRQGIPLSCFIEKVFMDYFRG